MLSDGATLTLHQDASSHWLCVRFTGCNDKLERVSGLLGFVDLKRWSDGFSENLKEATATAIMGACAGFVGGDTVNIRLAAKVLKSIEIYNADAAGDEQLSGKMLRGQALEDITYQESYLPNVKVIHRDKTHAARRLTSRGWKADAYLNEVQTGPKHRIQIQTSAFGCSDLFGCLGICMAKRPFHSTAKVALGMRHNS